MFATALARERLLSTASTVACTEDDGEQPANVESTSTAGSVELVDGGEAGASPASAEGFRLAYKRDVVGAARLAWLMLLALVCGCMAFACLFAWASTSSNSYMALMLTFAAFAPASYASRWLMGRLRGFDHDFCCVSMTICTFSRRERHLMEALRFQLARTRGLDNCAEAVVEQQDNPCGGASWEVELRPLKSVIQMQLRRGDRCELLAVSLDGGGDGGLPRRAELNLRASSSLTLMTAAWRPSDVAEMCAAQDSVRDFLHRWLQHIYADYMRTSTGIVEVYELVKENKDAPLAWTRVRQERSVTANGEGMWHYAMGDWALALKNRAEYAIRHRGKTRVNLFLSGAKGSGKTLFVEWLAGELGLPLYNVDLSSPHVTNDTLREVITPNKLVHNLPVIFHVDEFQAMIGEWSGDRTTASRPRSLVTIQGLQSILEGTSTPNNAIFVFTSSRPLPYLVKVGARGGEEQHEWRGLLRRFPVQVQIPMLGTAERQEYCRHYLSAYVKHPWDPKSAKEQLRWADFEAAWATVENGVPIDMIAKYAQERTQTAYIGGMMTSLPEGCKVKEECCEKYLDGFFDAEAVFRWISEYAGNSAVL